MSRPDAVVEVDPAICVGSGWCTNVAPAAFVLGDDAKARTADIASARLDDLEEAEDGCPVGAITVTRTDGGTSR